MKGLQCFTALSMILPAVLFGTATTSAAVDAWTNLGIYGGKVQVVSIDPSDPGRLFAGTWGGEGLYRSIDAASSWRALKMAEKAPGEDTFNNQALLALTISVANPSVVWAAHNFWVAKSEDGGNSWKHFYNSKVQRDCQGCGGERDNWRYCYALVSDPTDEKIIYLGTAGAYGGQYPEGAIYKTIDGGETWEKVNKGNNLDHTVISLAIDANNPDIIWAATTDFNGAGTVYRSTNGGQNWTPLAAQPFSNKPLNKITLSPDTENEIFVAGSAGVSKGEFNGTNWNFSYPISGCQNAFGLEYALSDSSVLYVAWRGDDGVPHVSRSMDGGNNWETYSLDGNLVSEPRTLAIAPNNPDTLYLGDNGGGVLKSEDQGQTWTQVNIGLTGVVVNDVALDENDTTHMIAGTEGGVYERKNDIWHRRLSAPAYSVEFVSASSDAYLAGLDDDLAKTVDGGATWAISSAIANGRIFDIAIDPEDSRTLFIADESHVRRSVNGGDVFQPVLEGVNQAKEGYKMRTIAFDPSDSSHLYAGGGNFTDSRVQGDLWESVDGGDSWQRTGLTNVIVNKVVIDPRDANTLYAGIGYRDNIDDPVYKSTDGGLTWNAATSGMPTKKILLHEVWADSETNVYATGGNGDILYYDGSDSNLMRTGGTQRTAIPEGIFGLDADHVYVVGQEGTILSKNGKNWVPMESNSEGILRSIWGSAPDDLFAVGQEGTILHYDGSQWHPMESGTTTLLRQVFGTSSRDVFAVGNGGLIVHYDGNTWSPMATPTSEDLESLWAASANAVFAGGVNGAMLYYDGRAWTSMSLGIDAEIEGLWGNSADDVYAVGDEIGLFLHYDGTQWKSSTIPDAQIPSHLWGVPSGYVFVVDYQGGLFRYDGTGWEVLRASGNRLRSVTDLAFHRLNPDILYASTLGAGVFITPNQADKWLKLGTAIGDVNAISAGSLYAATGNGLYQLTGTGVIAGQVSSLPARNLVDGAWVYNDIGAQCLSIEGEYMMVSAAGICTVTASAIDHKTTTIEDVTVYGSDVAWVDIQMEKGNSVNAKKDETIHSDTSSGSSYCFIHTASSTLPDSNK